MKDHKKNLAAIDVGTNSIHLVVAEGNADTGRFKVLDREKAMVRLGEGSTDMKHLSEDAMDRALLALRRFRMIADSRRATIRAVATSAVREALNQDEFLRRVKSETGITIEIASGFEEARLIHFGVLQALPIFNKKHLMVDIGGGSTEFLVGQQRKILYSNSLKVGAVRVTQRCFDGPKITHKSIEECSKYVRGMLNPICRSVRKHRCEIAVGTSGTIMNIAKIIKLQRGEDEDESLNNFTFTRNELFGVIEQILEAGRPEDRARIEGMDPSRTDIIVAGAIILDQVFWELGLKAMTVSEFALREGIILDTLEKNHRNKRIGHLHDLRYTNVLHLAESLHYEKSHSHQVAKLAMAVFDQTKRLHRLGPPEREYLEAAALLHEVGLFVSHAQHHRHSYYLIRNSEMLGFTENEKEIIANIARYHRKSHPKLKHEGFRKLSPVDQALVKKLGSILRIADGLDRTHSSSIRDVRCRLKGRSIEFQLRRVGKMPLELELWGAERKKELFEETFRAKVIFVLRN